MHAYHFETHARKEFVPFWNKHAVLPLKRMAAYFGGHITITCSLSTLPVTHMSYSSPFIFVFYLLHGFMLSCFCFTISLHCSPWFFTLSLVRYNFMTLHLPATMHSPTPTTTHIHTALFKLHVHSPPYLLLLIFTTLFIHSLSQAHAPPV